MKKSAEPQQPNAGLVDIDFTDAGTIGRYDLGNLQRHHHRCI